MYSTVLLIPGGAQALGLAGAAEASPRRLSLLRPDARDYAGQAPWSDD